MGYFMVDPVDKYIQNEKEGELYLNQPDQLKEFYVLDFNTKHIGILRG